MLTYSIEDRGAQSIYEYLYEQIKKEIVSGALKAHDKLPSKRAFADNNGISVITVENTYGQLLAEGYIYSKPKSGFYVSPIDSMIDIKAEKTEITYRIQEEKESDYLSLISNHTLADHFPFSIWAKIMRQLMTDQSEGLLKAPPTGGVWDLRIAIAKHLMDFRGIICQPDQIIIGAGTEYLYGLIVQLLGREKTYGLENPSSRKIRKIYEALGVQVTSLEMDREGVCPDCEGLSLADIIQISPSHQFPTGIVTSINRRYGLLQWANEKEERYIIEDDYDSEFRLAGKPIPSLFSIDTTDRVIYFNTFTKSLSSTIRISYMVLPRPLLHRFREELGFYACTVSNFEQYALAAFIREQYFEKHINRMRKHYKQMRDTLIASIKETCIGDRITIAHEDSGLHFIMELQTKQPDALLKEKALKQGIEIAFLSDYVRHEREDSETKYNHKAIVNYSGLELEVVENLPELLEMAWKEVL